MEKKLVYTLLFILVAGIATAPVVQHHPISEVFPADDSLGLGGNDIKNVSVLETAIVRANNSQLDFRHSGGTDILSWDSVNDQWDFKKDINTTDQNVTSGEELCVGKYC